MDYNQSFQELLEKWRKKPGLKAKHGRLDEAQGHVVQLQNQLRSLRSEWADVQVEERLSGREKEKDDAVVSARL